MQNLDALMYTRHGWQKSIGGIWGRGLEDIKPNAKPGKTAPAPLREQMGMSHPDPTAQRKEPNRYANRLHSDPS